MTLQLRTLNQILADLQAFFNSNSPDTLLQEGTVPEDIVDVFSQEGNTFYVIQTYVQLSKTIPGCQQLISNTPDAAQLLSDLGTALKLTPSQVQAFLNLTIDNLAANFGITRLQATAATLVLRFFTTSGGPANIPINTIARTPDLTAIQYQTSIAVVAQPVTLDPITGLFYIDVPAQAVVPGTASIVPTNRITLLSPPLAGFSKVTNITPSSGGTDTESNASVLSRCLLSLKGREIDTLAGLTLFSKSQVGVLDAEALDNTSPFVTRGVGNQVDIRIVGSTSAVATDTVVYSSVIINHIGGLVLNKQPVISVISLTVNSVPKVQGVDFVLGKDTGGFSGSDIAMDKIVFLVSTPSPGDVIVVQYTYDKLMGDIQDALAQPGNQIPNSDILVREADKLLIDIQAQVVVLSGFTVSQVQAAVSANVTAYFNALGLGQPAIQSKVADVINGTPGVDHLVLPFTQFAVHPNPGATDITVNPIQYARLNSLIFL